MTELGFGSLGEAFRTSGIMAMLLVVLGFYIKNRQLNLLVKQDDRQGYGTLIDRLEKQVADIYQKLEQCEKERDADRLELRGLRDQFLQYQLAIVERLPTMTKSPEIGEMVRSLKSVRDDGEGRGDG